MKVSEVTNSSVFLSSKSLLSAKGQEVVENSAGVEDV